MSKEFVIYQGVRMIKGWPEQIEAAQLQPTVTVAGQERQRLRYGQEADDLGRRPSALPRLRSPQGTASCGRLRCRALSSLSRSDDFL